MWKVCHGITSTVMGMSPYYTMWISYQLKTRFGFLRLYYKKNNISYSTFISLILASLRRLYNNLSFIQHKYNDKPILDTPSVNIVKSHPTCFSSFRTIVCVIICLVTFQSVLLYNYSLYKHVKRNINLLFHEYLIIDMFIRHLKASLGIGLVRGSVIILLVDMFLIMAISLTLLASWTKW